MSNTANRIGIAVLVVALVASCAMLAVGFGRDRTVAGTAVAGSGSVTKPNQPDGGGVDPKFVHGTDDGPIDRLAATVITDVQDFWRDTFPQVFGSPWQDIDGGFYSVDTADPDAEAPPCTDKPSDVEGNAFYCPTADIVAWDRAALLPVLKERFGDVAIMVVFSHEIGHAVQRRSGLTLEKQQADPQKYPTILIESMADCYAGSFVRWVSDGHAPHLQISKEQLDSAMESLIVFRDPVGTSQTDEGAHGDAFDRVSAFQDGFTGGPKLCSQMTVANHKFTQTAFLRESDQATGGNMPFNDLVTQMAPNLDAYFGAVVGQLGKQWPKPTVKPSDNTPACGDAQGPVAFCPSTDEIDVDATDELRGLHTSIGDYATGTLLASRYGLATLSAAGKPTNGEQAQHQVLCLAGSYTGALLDTPGQFTLSPGDLDEAVQVLLEVDYAGRDDTGKAMATGFDRIDAFRTGVLQGVGSCQVT
ncbi:neutral zinc metallopeptidase [Labedaea rhizosphaerae]|uniref:Putative metalloprotease n=1 Tax=Labedaea rhizosphaerae TaxID=598644 RepID=A0A4R6SEM4_LABRH|nr:neutral zinc metallopeptidase [Labedaea rhizosphaerae]TDP97585.1 putative metalloprotease [Labedaea rhizosphaerae]